MTKLNDITQLQPHDLWKNFQAICNTPHPSHHMEPITKLMTDFGKSLNLETLVDKAGNILIRKSATIGMENRTPVILQAHVDMVPQKNSDKQHTFETDPIETIIDGDWVKANGTTLGADNGIGVAAAMAVLESKELKHGPIEAFFTVNEETGMDGAFGLEQGLLKGDILINMDSEEEGQLYVGCAGGIDANISWHFKGCPVPEDDVAIKVSILGLKGGHSGLDIDLGRANANKLLFRFLKEAIMQYEARLAAVEGGNMRNAIPREAWAIITVPADCKRDIEKLATEYEALFNEEYKVTENPIKVSTEVISLPEGLLPEEIQDDFVNAITGCPNGVFRFIPDIPSIVETSTNLSIIEANHEKIEVKCLLRSSVDSKKEELASMMESVFALAGAKIEFTGGYSGWNPNLKSPILQTMSEVYKNKFDKTAEVKVIHAGLECGILGAIEPRLDMVSFGPTIRHPHSPDEKVSIPSVQKFWDFLVATLETIPTK
ncbi:MAG TPA: aminoacyl-histidine dipeptidase [Paludibacteraceae bacterium]|nr:aminoacyl-histidine dipeptidase [Paludibacteraceae bacterium]HQB69526.1 aminoacyl-histidine dipeptidase [Paludibacteraceae bacterium]HRS68195.1 aminoacyl-histidine dipeptidase [Paludibacteraceae bacterium]